MSEANGGEAASLSLSHNSTGAPAQVESAEQRELPFRLTGSQKKTAFALEKNIGTMIAEAGIERVAFLTLTVGDEVEGEAFRQVWEPDEAGRRINSLLTHLLGDLFDRMVVVTERHKSGAIHFHLIVEHREALRGDFDFAAFLTARNARKAGTPDFAAEKRYEESATPALRALWGILRERLPGYGFGRAELTPIYKSADAISRYVAKYVEKNLFNRRDDDKGRRLVRYSGWGKTHLRACDFSWATPKACEWRRKVRAIAGTVRIWTREDMARIIGPRWAHRASEIMWDVNLGGWAKQGEREWHEGDMTRDEGELCATFMERSAQSHRAGVDAMTKIDHEALWSAGRTAAGQALQAQHALEMEELSAWWEWQQGEGEAA